MSRMEQDRMLCLMDWPLTVILTLVALIILAILRGSQKVLRHVRLSSRNRARNTVV